MDTKGLKRGDLIRAGFSITGKILRFEKERYGVVAIIDTGSMYTRKIPVTSLESLS